jgi:tripartite-type tricarboxylate transporter receptor subunit TctC
VFAPKATPVALVTRLNQEFNRALATQDVKDKFFNAGVLTLGGAPSVAVTGIKGEISKWGKLIKELGIQEE